VEGEAVMDLALTVIGACCLIAALVMSQGVPCTQRAANRCMALTILSGVLFATGAYLWRT
jgi:hypothetical protein